MFKTAVLSGSYYGMRLHHARHGKLVPPSNFWRCSKHACRGLKSDVPASAPLSAPIEACKTPAAPTMDGAEECIPRERQNIEEIMAKKRQMLQLLERVEQAGVEYKLRLSQERERSEKYRE